MTNVLVGTCIGDALGMPFEGLARDNVSLTSWDGETFLPSRERPPTFYGSNLSLKPAQYTDDGQMTIMVAESLLEKKGFDPDDLSKRYVDWIASGKARGYGRTTLLAVQNLQKGDHWMDSGVVGSYGNGTAMRAAPFGVYFRKDKQALISAVKDDSGITHSSSEAEAGALAIALATYYIVNDEAENYSILKKIAEDLPDSVVKYQVERVALFAPYSVPADCVLKVFGTRADVRQTVPSALYCFFAFNNFQDAIVAAIRAGGDTDTTAAIVGALHGAKNGVQGIDSKFHVVEDFDKLIKLDSQLFSQNNDDLFSLVINE